MSFTPIIMRNAKLVFGAVETSGTAFELQARSIVLTPDTNVQRIKTLSPAGQFSDVDDPEWTLEIGYVVGDVDGTVDAIAFADYLLQNKGDKVPVFFRPVAGGKGYKVTATIVAGAVGGEQGSFSEQSVSLPCDGQPEDLAPPAP